MIRSAVIELFAETLIALVLLFAIIKFALMYTIKVRGGYLVLFFGTMQIFSRQSIRNTFDGGMKKYMRISNKVNMAFYSVIGVILVIYLLMLAI